MMLHAISSYHKKTNFSMCISWESKSFSLCYAFKNLRIPWKYKKELHEFVAHHAFHKTKKLISPFVYNQLADYSAYAQNYKHVSKDYGRTSVGPGIIEGRGQPTKKSYDYGYGNHTSIVKKARQCHANYRSKDGHSFKSAQFHLMSWAASHISSITQTSKAILPTTIDYSPTKS